MGLVEGTYTGRQLRNCSADVLDYIRQLETCFRKQILKPYNASPTVPPDHHCCEICMAQCTCGSSCKADIHPSLEFEIEEEEEPEDWWDLSESDLDTVRSELQAYRDSLPSSTLLHSKLAHGLPDSVIEEIVDMSSKLTSPEDVLSMCSVRSFTTACAVWQILAKIVE